MVNIGHIVIVNINRTNFQAKLKTEIFAKKIINNQLLDSGHHSWPGTYEGKQTQFPHDWYGTFQVY